MDPAVRRYEVIYAGGGGIDALLKITTAELLRVSSAEIAPMLEDEKSAKPGETAEDES
jgi:prolyl-tRNA editing enzyme YbaK/EbsC (Cys-tRNA(Pro) deacylase)